MKYLKSLVKWIAALVVLLIVVLLVTLWVDGSRTQYLQIDEHPELANQTYLIKNVHVIPMTSDTIYSDVSVLIRNGKIEAVGGDVTADAVAIIDGGGQYLMPGLIDMHVHVWDEYELGLYLANGVTGVRNLWGMPMHLRMKEAIVNDELLAPTFFTTGPKLTGPEFMGDDNLSLHTPQEAKEKIKSYKEAGYDFIKTYYGLTSDLYEAVLQQASESNMDVVAHPSPKVPFSYHLKSQIKSIEHAEEIVQQPLQFDLDTLKLQPIIDTIASYKEARYSPTLRVFDNINRLMTVDDILNTEVLQYMNPMIKMADSKAQFDRWDNAKANDSTVVERIYNQHLFHLEIVKRLHNAGVTLICGTDAGIGITVPGFAIHEELQLYKQAGLSNFEVLQTATVNAANTHTSMQNMGTIETGKLANLILVKDNPLEDLSALQQPNKVWVEGRMLSREFMDEMLDEAKGRKNLWASGLRYLEALLSK